MCCRRYGTARATTTYRQVEQTRSSRCEWRSRPRSRLSNATPPPMMPSNEPKRRSSWRGVGEGEGAGEGEGEGEGEG